MLDIAVKRYIQRRAKRLEERGINPGQFRKSKDGHKVLRKELRRNLSRMDAPGDGEEEPQNSKKSGGGSGGHGNTKLPFGLCKRFGIDIGEGWGPREAWDALAGKGITPDGAFERLEKGEDPGTPPDGGDEGTESKVTGETETAEEPEPPKEPVKSFVSDDGKEYKDIELRHTGWSESPYRIRAKSDDGVLWKVFSTKGDMMWYLKEKGVEEVVDPDTGEILNPKEMELPEKLFRSYDWSDKWFSAATIGLRKGRYTVVGTDMDGKKRELESFASAEKAKEWLSGRGVPEEKVKLSPALKKREAERTAWLTSDKKEYVEKDGVRYGDLRVDMDVDGSYRLRASSEDGKERINKSFPTRTEAIEFLKEQGVERAKIGDEYLNPQEHEMPDTVATVLGRRYQKFRYGTDYRGRITLTGIDLDGREHDIDSLRGYESFEDFKNRVLTICGIDESAVDLDENMKEKIRQREEKDAAKAKWKAEFEAKAIDVGGEKFCDLALETDSDGDVCVVGYDRRGAKRRLSSYRKNPVDFADWLDERGIDYDLVKKTEEEKKAFEEYKQRKEEFEKRAVIIDGTKCTDLRMSVDDDGDAYFYGRDIHGEEIRVSYWMDMYEAEEKMKKAGLDPDKVQMSKHAREIYNEYKKRAEEFEEKAVLFAGSGVKLADPYIDSYGDLYVLRGYDKRGRKKVIAEGPIETIKEELERSGTTIDGMPMSDDAKKSYGRWQKEESGIASGEYKKYKGHAFKDFKVFKEEFGDGWAVIATDIDGTTKDMEYGLSFDDAIDEVEKHNITDYKVGHFVNGEPTFDLKRPTDGMRKVRMIRTKDGTFKIMATTGKGTTSEVHSASTEKEARKWLKDNGVDESTIRTRGMNPNDDVPRTHTAKSLSNFDEHKAKMETEYPILDNMTDAEKQEVVDMMTECFDKGAYRMRREGHFEEIVLGRFKSTLETGTSGGATGNDLRRYTEKETFGIEGHTDEEGEKYGYLGVEDDVEELGKSTASGYGGFLYKFRKDKVEERTTYTCGDSLDCSWTIEGDRDRAIAGYAGSKPTYEGISALSEIALRSILDDYRQYKNGGMTYNEFLRKFSGSCADRYIEVHYHDLLKIEDVESIAVKKSDLKSTFSRMSEESRKRVVTKLKDCGIIFQTVNSHGEPEDAYEYLREEFGIE